MSGEIEAAVADKANAIMALEREIADILGDVCPRSDADFRRLIVNSTGKSPTLGGGRHQQQDRASQRTRAKRVAQRPVSRATTGAKAARASAPTVM